jgi:hypothetical protein
MYRGGDYDSLKIKSNLVRSTPTTTTGNSLPYPFSSADVQFWFEKGITNLSRNSVTLDTSRRIASVADIASRTALFFNNNASSILELAPSGGSLLLFSGDRAFSIWFYQLSTSSPYSTLCGKDTISGSTREWNFVYVLDGSANMTKTVFNTFSSDGAGILGSGIKGDSVLNAWTHWIVNYDHASATFLLYRNGTLVDSAVLSGSYNASSAPVCLGGMGVSGNPSSTPQNGYCSQFVGFTRKLTDTEIAALYNNGSGLYGGA